MAFASLVGCLGRLRLAACLPARDYSVGAVRAPTHGPRHTTKHEFARKTFLVDQYTHLNRSNEVVLYVHHNNLTKTENKRFRADLARSDARLTLIRNSIYNVYLKLENAADPADHATSVANREVVHPILPLLNGPTAIITVPRCDPAAVTKVLKVLKAANEKLILIGAKIEQRVFGAADVERFKELPSKEDLRAHLLATLTVLGGSGLVQVLETPLKLLYLTGRELVKREGEERQGEGAKSEHAGESEKSD